MRIKAQSTQHIVVHLYLVRFCVCECVKTSSKSMQMRFSLKIFSQCSLCSTIFSHPLNPRSEYNRKTMRLRNETKEYLYQNDSVSQGKVLAPHHHHYTQSQHSDYRRTPGSRNPRARGWRRTIHGWKGTTPGRRSSYYRRQAAAAPRSDSASCRSSRAAWCPSGSWSPRSSSIRALSGCSSLSRFSCLPHSRIFHTRWHSV